MDYSHLSSSSQGVLSARGKYILMVDADGATKIDDLSGLEASMQRIEKVCCERRHKHV